MTFYQEVDGPEGVVRIKPEWMIALSAPELHWDKPLRRCYMHGGAQILVLDTPENLAKLLPSP